MTYVQNELTLMENNLGTIDRLATYKINVA